MYSPVIQDILLVLGSSVIVVYLFQRITLPAVLGYLVTGVLIGPYGFDFVHELDTTGMLPQIEVSLLFFVIGVELSFKDLFSNWKTVFLAGMIQSMLSVLVVFITLKYLGFPLGTAIFFGFLFSLSSSVVLLKLLQERHETNLPHGKVIIGMLTFQGLAAVPMMLLVPVLAGHKHDIPRALLETGFNSLIIISITLIAAFFITPTIMHWITRTKNKELLMLASITLCFSFALLATRIGLSMAFGAFLGGLVISQSSYTYQASSAILPFKELFSSFFFVSCGMFLDMEFVLNNLGMIMLLVGLLFFVKGALVSMGTLVLNYPPRTVLLCGLALFQVGEFSLIMAREGLSQGIMNAEHYQYFLAITIVSLMITPVIILFAEEIAEAIIPEFINRKWGVIPKRDRRLRDIAHRRNHLVIIGYGINGRNVAKAARIAGIPYVILDMNPDLVASGRGTGEPMIFGDALNDHTLETIGINTARVVVVAVSDAYSTRKIVSGIRERSQRVYVIARTRYVKDITELLLCGADEVVPEEFETSIQIFTRVLHQYLVPIHEIRNLAHSIRANDYRMFSDHAADPDHLQVNVPRCIQISCIRVGKDYGKMIGIPLGQTDVRKHFGVNILAIARRNEMINAITPQERLLHNDMVYVSGDQEHIHKFYEELN